MVYTRPELTTLNQNWHQNEVKDKESDSNIREEAKVHYPKLIAKQDAVLKELKYGVPEQVQRFRLYRLIGLYVITFGTAAYGLVKILDLKWPQQKPCKPCTNIPG